MQNETNSTGTYIQKILVTNPLSEPLIRSAIQVLKLPPGSNGLDAGCGIGLQVLLLAEAVGSSGHVTGLDLRPEFLNHAMKIAEKHSLSDRITFREGDINHLPFEDNSFDWVWSSNCAGYPAAEPLPLMSELARVVRPGGIVSILIWSSQNLLPGYPFLEARLNATSAGIAPFCRGMRPENHYLRALGWFRDAGLKESTVCPFTGSAHAPLSQEMRNALCSLIDMRWIEVRSELTEEDWKEYQRLCLPDSPDFILNLPDYYAFYTYSLFYGKVAY
jgi:ubiquinone/menaquinone biosynthesis C-methylase UbiE